MILNAPTGILKKYLNKALRIRLDWQRCDLQSGVSMQSVFERIKFHVQEDRLGPDMPLTHMLSHFPGIYGRICKKKFLSFGENAAIRPGASVIFCSSISIGKNVVIRPASWLYGYPGQHMIDIEDDVLLGTGVHIYSSNHKFSDPDVLISAQGHATKGKTVVKKGAWIGANAIVLPGLTIGKHAVIGAGSVVTKNIPDYAVFAGNPAKFIRKIV